MSDFPIFDGHNDTLLNLHLEHRGNGRSFFERSDIGHIDLPRAREGGLAGGFFAVFTPNRRRPLTKKEKKAAFKGIKMTKDGYEVPLPKPIRHKDALRFTTAVATHLFEIERASEGEVKIVRTAEELEHCLKNGTFATIFHIEGAEAIDTNYDALHILHAAGLRSLGLVWSRPTKFGYGVPFSFPKSPDIGPGLTKKGKGLVRTCNELRVLIDLSHLNEQGFWDVAKISDAPLVATHSNAHTLCPSPRNLTDKQLDAIKETGGMVGINFHTGFLRRDGRFKETTSLIEIGRHLTYIADRIGIEHVGFGSDFDGATMPDDLVDVTGLPKLIEALRQAGLDDDALQKVTHQNWVRVLRQTWGE
ncbi:dipeptidase [Candidatus Leptofilum sp.]|uniref:dipeptidase n=1 Tax=Candidatus Leptofilum sp. TaxID=3241576 RepID=UPI003B5AC787